MTNIHDPNPDAWPEVVGHPILLDRDDMTPEEIHAAVGMAAIERALTPPELLAVGTRDAFTEHAAWSTTARFPEGYTDAAHPQQYMTRCGKWLPALGHPWAEVAQVKQCQRCARGDAPGYAATLDHGNE